MYCIRRTINAITIKYMRTQYIEADYYVKIRGRGVYKVHLTKNQVKALRELLNRGELEIESIQITEYPTHLLNEESELERKIRTFKQEKADKRNLKSFLQRHNSTYRD